MLPPTSEQPIVRGTTRGGEREPGSVIAARTAIPPKVNLGHIERTCLRCGKGWGDDVRTVLCPHCGFNECEVKEVPPTMIEVRGWEVNGRAGVDVPIIGTETLQKALTPLAVTDAELASLRSLRSAIVALEGSLQVADANLHQLVDRSDENRNVFAFLQGAVHGLWDGNIGDFELRATGQVTALSLRGPLKALREEIDHVLLRYEAVLGGKK